MGRGAAALVVGVVVALTLAGCTGVPSSSAPDTIEPITLGEAPSNVPSGPDRDEDPRSLVTNFQSSNAFDPVKHNTSRAYLTPAMRRTWSDSTVTILSGTPGVSNYDAAKHEVVIRGRVVGSLDASGSYQPSLLGNGNGGDVQPFVYHIAKENGQYRIDRLPPGLLLTVDQFQSYYKQYPLYFFSLSKRYLVPDVRWSALTEPQLSDWLLSQLAAGPRTELRNAVSTDTFPSQASSHELDVRSGQSTTVEIAGSSQLDSAGKRRLAAQVSQTLDTALQGEVLRIVDDGITVAVPGSTDGRFTASNFGTVVGPSPPPPNAYYLRNGRIVSENGTYLGGKGNTGHILNSIALTPGTGGHGLTIAAVSGTGSSARLFLGSQNGGLRGTNVVGDLSRPAWSPDQDEVWIGDSGRLVRVVPGAHEARASTVSVPSINGRIVAVRLSPEGSRVAMVVSGNHDTKQLFVGSIVRTASQVRVDGLQSISPMGAVVSDLAWVNPTKLFAIGYEASSKDSRVYETNVDGSFWTARDIGSLPAAPDSVTEAAGQQAWVSANNTVWVQNGRTWYSPVASDPTTGTNPIYLE